MYIYYTFFYIAFMLSPISRWKNFYIINETKIFLLSLTSIRSTRRTHIRGSISTYEFATSWERQLRRDATLAAFL